MRTLISLSCILLFLLTAEAQTVIQMEKKGGVYYVPCTVNGLKLSFIFDTGASDVSISLSEALFMLKNGYLSEDDLLGTEYYRIANGDVAEGTKINLRSIVIGGKELRNVKASIVHSATAPLLLGQSVLERFGNVSINYGNQTLVLGGSGSTVSPQPPSTSGASPSDSFVDTRDGKRYKTVKIGNQEWMAENLAFKPPTGKYWAYDNNPKNVEKYGYLYDWSTANKVCPKGWHLPSDVEWTELENFLGGNEVAGSKIKEAHSWSTSAYFGNRKGTNSSGFLGLPSGYHNSIGNFFDGIGLDGYWWSSTATSESDAWARVVDYTADNVGKYSKPWPFGYPVRCIKD